MPIIGAHVSTAVSLGESLVRAKHIEAEATQIFISPPQQWNHSAHSQEEIEEYLRGVKVSGIKPNFIHATYLINLGTENPEHLKKSIDWIDYGLEMANKMGIRGVILHTGSHKGRGFEVVKNQIIKSIQEVLQKSRRESFIILENCAGSGGVIGSFEELGEIIKGVGDERVKVCLDTQHAFAQGYDFREKEGFEKLLSDLDKNIGLENIAAIHCNDSKVEPGSKRDRHENIGDGFIGTRAFSRLLNHLAFKDTPFILEVPGFSGGGPDLENIKILKSLIIDNSKDTFNN